MAYNIWNLRYNSPVFSLYWARLIHALLCYFFKVNFNIILPCTSRHSKFCFSFRLPHQKHFTHFFSPPYKPHIPPTCVSLFCRPNNIWWELRIIKFLVIGSPVSSSYLLLLRSEYLPQHQILERRQNMLFPERDSQICTPMNKTSETVVFLHFNFQESSQNCNKKNTISFVMSGRPHRIPRYGFSWNLMFELFFSIICPENSNFIKTDKNSKCFKLRPIYIFDHISLNYS